MLVNGERHYLNIHFTAEDLLRSRLLGQPDPLWEVVLSLSTLRSASPPARDRTWWQRARREIVQHRGVSDAVHSLGMLVPPRGDFPDFLTPAEAPMTGASTIKEAAEHIRAVPRSRMRLDIRQMRGGERRAASLLSTVDSPGYQNVVADQVETYFRFLLSPIWDNVGDEIRRDQGTRTTQTVSGGIENLLAGLPAPLQWSWPTLRPPTQSTATCY
ncbi:hypothetical protein [Amycolatopsis sp. CA-230715]|uniref:hypothetical protein n=1 Tax=Amycolatopsis sp. CA-230715 TaxID=2745196 RepID=UPI001C02AFE2|nr:hypothetical protein [Amycolatopsis sp. CA-230715]QWF85840.1 hypothetical protein HUW46_09320 [Amycolatopsis sp. CA-230715]